MRTKFETIKKSKWMELKMNFNFINYFTKFIPKIKGWNLKKNINLKNQPKKPNKI